MKKYIIFYACLMLLSASLFAQDIGPVKKSLSVRNGVGGFVTRGVKVKGSYSGSGSVTVTMKSGNTSLISYHCGAFTTADFPPSYTLYKTTVGTSNKGSLDKGTGQNGTVYNSYTYMGSAAVGGQDCEQEYDYSKVISGTKIKTNDPIYYKRNIRTYDYAETGRWDFLGLDLVRHIWSHSLPVTIELDFSGGMDIDDIDYIDLPGFGKLYKADLLPDAANNADVITILKDFGSGGKIKRYHWDNLYGKEQTLNLAELDLSAMASDYEIKIASQFIHPITGQTVDPADCKEICGYYPVGSDSKYCYPFAGQFNSVSRYAAMAGAIFATNGTYFDYYQNCLPGLTSYVKEDGTVQSTPDYRSFMGTGAVGFNSNGTFGFAPFDMGYDDRNGYQDYLTSINTFANSYTNVMSGGALSYKQDANGNYNSSQPFKQYQFKMPTYCYPITRSDYNSNLTDPVDYDFGMHYPWDPGVGGSDPELYNPNANPGDIDYEVATWATGGGGDTRNIWCPNIPAYDKNIFGARDESGYQYPKGWTYDTKTKKTGGIESSITMPKSDSYGRSGDRIACASDIYTGSSMEKILYGCAKNQRNFIKFHDPSNNSLARTFIAKKGNKLIWGNSNGSDKSEAKETLIGVGKFQQGFTMEQMGQFAEDFGTDFWMNLDGGGSTTFFVNGRGAISNSTDEKIDREGVYKQRQLEYALMLVPKKKTGEIKSCQSTNNRYLSMDNRSLTEDRYVDGYGETPGEMLYIDRPEVKLVSLTPSLDKLTTTIEGGFFSTSFHIPASSGREGAILFSMSEDGFYQRRAYMDANNNIKGDGQFLDRQYRDYAIIGVGKIPSRLLKRLRVEDSPITLGTPEVPSGTVNATAREYEVSSSNGINYSSLEKYFEDSYQKYIGLYTIIIRDYKISHVFIHADESNSNYYRKWLDGNWHTVAWINSNSHENRVAMDGNLVNNGDGITLRNPNDRYRFYNLDHVTHAMLGAVNVDGHYVTGYKTQLDLDNTVFAVGNSQVSSLLNDLKNVSGIGGSGDLTTMSDFTRYVQENSELTVPCIGSWNSTPTRGIYLLQYEESAGLHSFATTHTPGGYTPMFNGLNLNGAVRSSHPASRKTAPAVATEAIEGLTLYPNPTDQNHVMLEFSLRDAQPLTVVITNLHGKVVQQFARYGEEGMNRIKLSDLGAMSNGVYLVQVRGEAAGFRATEKLILER